MSRPSYRNIAIDTLNVLSWHLRINYYTIECAFISFVVVVDEITSEWAKSYRFFYINILTINYTTRFIHFIYSNVPYDRIAFNVLFSSIMKCTHKSSLFNCLQCEWVIYIVFSWCDVRCNKVIFDLNIFYFSVTSLQLVNKSVLFRQP